MWTLSTEEIKMEEIYMRFIRDNALDFKDLCTNGDHVEMLHKTLDLVIYAPAKLEEGAQTLVHMMMPCEENPEAIVGGIEKLKNLEHYIRKEAGYEGRFEVYDNVSFEYVYQIPTRTEEEVKQVIENFDKLKTIYVGGK